MSINVSHVALASIHAFPLRDADRFVFVALPMTHTRINIKKTGNSNKNKEKNKKGKECPFVDSERDLQQLVLDNTKYCLLNLVTL